MNKINTLSVSLYKDEWFALENVDMNEQTYGQIAKALVNVFVKEYGKTGAQEHIKPNPDNSRSLLINQKKVPNIVKSLVHNPEMPIQVELRGRTATGQNVARTINKPFNVNQCTELIPYYNKNSKR